MSRHSQREPQNQQTMVIAGMDTPHFEFLAAAETRKQAIALMRRAWRVHCDRTGADRSFFSTDDVWTVQLAPGQALRDGVRII